MIEVVDGEDRMNEQCIAATQENNNNLINVNSTILNRNRETIDYYSK